VSVFEGEELIDDRRQEMVMVMLLAKKRVTVSSNQATRKK